MSDKRRNDDDFQSYIDLLAEYADTPDEEEDIVLNDDEDVTDTESEKSSISYDYEEEIVDDLPSPPPFNKDIEDISSNSQKQNIFKRISAWYNNLPKKKKIIVSIIAVILAVVIALGASLGIFVLNKFGLMGDNINGTETEDVIYDDGEFEDIDIDIGSAGFKQALQDWATQGNENRMSSKNVINVLLVGADSRNGVNEGNTDVMMLVSLNKKTKQLKMVSFLRDSYLYIQGKNGSYCSKLNAAYSMGGPQTLMETIENNYKIDIDSYVMVNFESFKAIVDAMGGVTVDVKKYEADYNYKKFKIELPYGEDVTLNGTQALCFCRIRGCDADGDVSRTRRQRQVIDAIINKVKTASLGDLNKYIDILLPYVDTGYSEGQILSLGIKAITGKWFNYERTQLQAPDEECRTSGSANAWIWVVDYQLAAFKLQNELYGQSNIKIDEGRTSIIDVYRGANYTGSSSSVVKPDNKDEPEATEEKIVTTTQAVSVNASETEVVSTESVSQSDTTAPETTEAVTDIIETQPVETTIPSTTLPPETEAVPEPSQTTEAVVNQ